MKAVPVPSSALFVASTGAAGISMLTRLPAEAVELKPAQATSMEVGHLKGNAFHTIERDGYRVVASLASGEGAGMFRVAGTFVPGQKLDISVPGPVGSEGADAEIVCTGDHLFVTGTHSGA